MTDDMMNLRSPWRRPGLRSAREMNGFAAERLMELEVGAATGATFGQEQPAAAGPAQRRPRAGLGDAGRTVSCVSRSEDTRPRTRQLKEQLAPAAWWYRST